MKIQKFFIVTLLLVSPSFTFAEIFINEIMYDVSGSDTGREWIEIYNSSPNTIDISQYKFLESSGASNHSLTLIQGTANLPQSGLAVIVSDSTKFLIDWPNFSGNLFKASFSSLNNTGGNLILKDSSLVVQNEVTYSSSQGAAGDGNTLQRNGLSWIASTPTPGVQNTGASSISSTTTNIPTITPDSSPGSSLGNSAHSSPAPLSTTEAEVIFEVSAGRDRLATVGNSVIFMAKPTKIKGLTEQGITYVWSFGDGTTMSGNVVSHAYKFPGEYVVVLNAQFSDEQAVSRLRVNVTSAVVGLSRVNGGTEIVNKSQSEINLEDWVLYSKKRSFVFPKDTLIPVNKKIIFSDDVTGMEAGDLELRSPLGKTQASFVAEITIPTVPEISTSTNDTEMKNLQAKIDELNIDLKKELAKAEVIYHEAPLIKVVALTATTTMPIREKPEVANVFEAEKKSNLISRVFAIPIKGINWVTRLFVEE